MAWLRTVNFADKWLQESFEEYHAEVITLMDKVQRIEARIQAETGYGTRRLRKLGIQESEVFLLSVREALECILLSRQNQSG